MINGKNYHQLFNNRLFQNVEKKEIKFNFQYKNFLKFNDGSIIYQAGAPSNNIYLVIAGQVRIKFYKPFGGSYFVEKTVNDFFGESELLDKTLRTSTAMALSECILYSIEEKDLQLLTKHKNILANLYNPDYQFDEVEQKSSAEENSFTENLTDSPKEDITKNFFDLAEMENSPEQEDDLSWNDNNLDEFTSLYDETELINDAEENILLHDSQPVFDYTSEEAFYGDELTNSSQIDNENRSQIIRSEAYSHGTQSNFSLIDEIKNDFEAETDISQTNLQLISEENPTQIENINSSVQDRQSMQKIPDINAEISKKKSLDIQSIEADEQRTVSLNFLLDEVKLPLESIENYSNILADNSSSPEAKKMLSKIAEQASLINSMINAYVEYFGGKINLNKRVYYAEIILSDILRLLAKYTSSLNIKLYSKFETDSVIEIDKHLFYIACLQVIKIISKHISVKRNIFVRVNRSTEELSIEFTAETINSYEPSAENLSQSDTFNGHFQMGILKKIIFEHNGTISFFNLAGNELKLNITLPIIK